MAPVLNVSLPKLTAWASDSSVWKWPPSPISAIAMRIEVAPMSITATSLGGRGLAAATAGTSISRSIIDTSTYAPRILSRKTTHQG